MKCSAILVRSTISSAIIATALSSSADTSPSADLTARKPASAQQRDSRTAKHQGCQPIPKCKQLTTCDEARDWLTRCGAVQLDSDRDGIPCEGLCGKR